MIAAGRLSIRRMTSVTIHTFPSWAHVLAFFFPKMSFLFPRAYHIPRGVLALVCCMLCPLTLFVYLCYFFEHVACPPPCLHCTNLPLKLYRLAHRKHIRFKTFVTRTAVFLSPNVDVVHVPPHRSQFPLTRANPSTPFSPVPLAPLVSLSPSTPRLTSVQQRKQKTHFFFKAPPPPSTLLTACHSTTRATRPAPNHTPSKPPNSLQPPYFPSPEPLARPLPKCTRHPIRRAISSRQSLSEHTHLSVFSTAKIPRRVRTACHGAVPPGWYVRSQHL